MSGLSDFSTRFNLRAGDLVNYAFTDAPQNGAPERETLFQLQGLARILNGQTNLDQFGFRFVTGESQKWQALEATTAAIRAANPDSPALQDARGLAALGILRLNIPDNFTDAARADIIAAQHDIAMQVARLQDPDRDFTQTPITNRDVREATRYFREERGRMERGVQRAFMDALESPAVAEHRGELARVGMLAFHNSDRIIQRALEAGFASNPLDLSTVEGLDERERAALESLDTGILPNILSAAISLTTVGFGVRNVLDADGKLSVREASDGLRERGVTFTAEELGDGQLTPKEVAAAVLRRNASGITG